MRVRISEREFKQIDELDLELSKLRDAKSTLEAAEREYQTCVARVAELFHARKVRTQTVDGWKHTLVQAERTKINEAGLKKAIGARAYNKLTKSSIDLTKVKAAIQAGELDPIVLEQHAEVTYNRPSFRISEAIEEPEE